MCAIHKPGPWFPALYAVVSFYVQSGGCSFCWHWWNCWPSLFKLYFNNFNFPCIIYCWNTAYLTLSNNIKNIYGVTFIIHIGVWSGPDLYLIEPLDQYDLGALWFCVCNFQLVRCLKLIISLCMLKLINKIIKNVLHY